MNKNKPRRNFIKKNLMLLFSLSFLNFDLIASKFKKKLKKRKNFIWYLNEND
tara:strand:- start:806 stop:961 length:156 start_codon:yes stop_codon:yes gene_type:complete